MHCQLLGIASFDIAKNKHDALILLPPGKRLSMTATIGQLIVNKLHGPDLVDIGSGAQRRYKEGLTFWN